jgi:hypothetical protein
VFSALCARKSHDPYATPFQQFKTIVTVVLMWALVTFPLTVLGSMRGKAHAVAFDSYVVQRH